MDAGEIKFCILQKAKELNSFRKMVLAELMTPFADCVASIVHGLNCSSRSAQKALAANYTITRVTIYAVRTFAFAPSFGVLQVSGGGIRF